MRPVLRGPNPQAGGYPEYRDAFDGLAGRIGMYCSYCERRIATNLAVEHIQPKSLPAYANLGGRWENFLLGCVNCNSTKGNKDVILGDFLMPDRDNTAAAYEYYMDGRISVPGTLSDPLQDMAKRTLALVGLNKRPRDAIDPNDLIVAKERFEQRMQVWLIAESSKVDLLDNPSDAFRRQIVRTALGHGFFSIWMTVFSNDLAVRKLLITEFLGTAADCFDANTTTLVSPRPSNGLANAGKL
jgi:uncharacterized protein (TIGR02646 family)